MNRTLFFQEMVSAVSSHHRTFLPHALLESSNLKGPSKKASCLGYPQGHFLLGCPGKIARSGAVIARAISGNSEPGDSENGDKESPKKKPDEVTIK